MKLQIKTRSFSNSSIVYLDGEYTLVERPLWWHRQGLSQTATGYGGKLISSRCVRFPDGQERRIYITCYGNAGSAWIMVNKQKIYLLD